jgi:hypothetical protein
MRLKEWEKNPTVIKLRYTSESAQWNAYSEEGELLQENLQLYSEDVEDNDLCLVWAGENIYEMEDVDVTVTAKYRYSNSYVSNGASLTLMGGMVIVSADNVLPKEAFWVKLASMSDHVGSMVEGTDYGKIDASGRYEDPNNTHTGKFIKFTACDMDGEPIKTASISQGETPPTGAAGKFWFDTSGNNVSLKAWSVSTLSWVIVESPYARIKCNNSSIFHDFRDGDVVKMTYLAKWNDAEGSQSAARKSAERLCNGTHLIVKKLSDSEIIVEGLVLPEVNYNYVTMYLDNQYNQPVQPFFQIERTAPEMDFIVAAGNRLWGCRYDEAAGINEIYASKLGDPTNWQVYQGLSTDAWAASRGKAAPFTGAAVLDGKPLFFREESLEKVYPSSSGAHQIQTFDLEGVESGAADSLVVIDERLFYKGRAGVMMYTGTLPQRISDEAFGGMAFTGGTAARHKRKYCISMAHDGERVVGVYDLERGDWHLETEAWTGKAITWRDQLYYVQEGVLTMFEDAGVHGSTAWWAETAPQTLELTEHRWISYIRIRCKLLQTGDNSQPVLRVFIAYDDESFDLSRPKRVLSGTMALGTREITIYPLRRDHFRLRLEGSGPSELYEISYRVERSEGGH